MAEATTNHSQVLEGSRHPPHNLTYPDAANRIAGTNEGKGITADASNLYQWAKQADDDSLWMLVEIGPPLVWIQIAFGTTVTSDDAYNNFGGPGIVTIDDGDLTHAPTAAYSFVVDLSAVTGVADGFQIVNGAYNFLLTRTSDDKIDWATELKSADIDIGNDITIDAGGSFSFDSAAPSNITVSGASADLTLGARGTTVKLNDVSNTALTGGIAGKSLLGALNYVAAAVGNVTLDQAYNNSGGPSSIGVDAGDVSWNPSGGNSFKVYIQGVTDNTDGFWIYDDVGRFTVLKDTGGSDGINWTAVVKSAVIDVAGSISIDSATNSNITVSGATADLTLGARGATVTLNDVSNTALTGGIAGKSLFGALNYLNGVSSGFTQGSVLFAGADGLPTEDNAGVFFDPATNRLGVNTAAPERHLHVKSNGILALMENTTTSVSAETCTILCPNVADGDSAARIYFGRARSTDELAHLSFVGSSTAQKEQMAFGFWGRDDLMSLEGTGNLSTVGELSIKLFAQDAEPTLSTDNFCAFWKDTNDSDKIYLVFRRGSGDHVKIELT